MKSVEAELSEQQALSHSLEECAKDAETLAQQLCQQLNAAQQQSAADKAVVLEQTATMQKMQSQVESLEQERQELKVLSGKLLEATQVREGKGPISQYHLRLILFFLLLF